ncbi:Hsp20/alpha crystallin family protein [Methanoregula sp.]|uniref:Hsp20/alpha crystallin family protein n=1 Tax=Methanoregula sp. TaxID=2052170 RepID=UPI002D14C1E9|nr:Hsp20/alpha crystallin family protein [Methanoregula sp.]HVP96081.1 Hsp20/alpha crystallin family protein [Methanoregula sp.]
MRERETSQEESGFDPLISKSYTGRLIYLTIELRGVVEEQIRIDLEKTTLTLSISENEKTLRKVIQVPEGVRLFRKKFSDGILEIVLEKPASPYYRQRKVRF